MSILRPRDPAVIAAVEVNDDYRIELRTDRKLTDYSPDEADKLADELIDAASEARRKFTADHPVGIRPLHAHGFDADGPVHPECRAGKCGNCGGQTMNGRDEMVPCTHGCHDSKPGWMRASAGEVWLIDWHTEADGAHFGDRAVKVSSGHFDLLDSFGYVQPTDIVNAKREASAS